jgi:uncharacterized protein YegP (UPF0339 family)
MKKAKFTIFRRETITNDGRRVAVSRFYFNLKATNGRIICQSEAYNSKQACKNGIASIKRTAAKAEVIDES